LRVGLGAGRRRGADPVGTRRILQARSRRHRNRRRRHPASARFPIGQLAGGRQCHPGGHQIERNGFGKLSRPAGRRFVERRLLHVVFASGSQLTGRCRRLIQNGRARARQQVPALLADDHAAALGREPRQQADLALRTARGVPRQPHAIRMPEIRLAVHFGELFLGEYELAVGHRIGRIPIGLIEAVHDQLARNLDRLGRILGVEHQPTAEAAGGFLVVAAENRIGPNGHEPGGLLGLVADDLLELLPAGRVANFPLAATDGA